MSIPSSKVSKIIGSMGTGMTGFRSRVLSPATKTLVSDFRLNHPATIILNDNEIPLKEDIDSILLEFGHVLLKNASFKDSIEFKSKYGNSLLSSKMGYLYGTNYRNDLGDGVLDVGTEPRHLFLAQHNEMAYLDKWPRKFMLGCIDSKITPDIIDNDDGSIECGITPTVNNRIMTEELSYDLYNKFMDYGVKYIRNFHDESNECNINDKSILYKSWQKTYETNNKEDIELDCELHNINYKWNNDNSLTIWYNQPSFILHPITNELLFFNSSLSMGVWFDGWKPFDNLDKIYRPMHTQWGNDQPITENEYKQLTNLYNKHLTGIYWEKGDILLIENMLNSHGRFPYKQGIQRDLAILFGEIVERTDDIYNKPKVSTCKIATSKVI